MQENFIPQHSLKALIDNEQGQRVDAIREEEASSVVMASFDKSYGSDVRKPQVRLSSSNC